MQRDPADAADAADAAEQELRTVAEALTTPLPDECVLCYVWRMLDAFGCNATLRWTRRWRDARAPRATALEHRLGRRGGFCDCEIFLNGWRLRTGLAGTSAGEAGRRAVSTVCGGVRRGSAQPCPRWVRRPRHG